ncbi:MAG TPA: endonuclease VII domain-containing protein [Actinomycetota bacterium]|nr:endonuclease VII domain-containing protein [Actinomycetota bacterium]
MSTRSRGPATCHPERALFARGLCQSCYRKLRQEERPIEEDRRRRGVRLCSRCGQEKLLDQFPKEHGRCKPCYAAVVREYAEAHKDDPAFIEARRRRSREWARRNRAYARNAHLLRKYGITAEDYDRLLEEQGGVCAICGRRPKQRYLAVDHEHGTGRVRGLLCDPCNQMLGFAEDDPERLRKAIAYLTR